MLSLVMLSVIMLSVIMLGDIMLNVVMLNVVAQFEALPMILNKLGLSSLSPCSFHLVNKVCTNSIILFYRGT
jgi:hypothetical protein